MSALRGFAVTAVGNNLIARLAATSKPLEFTRVLFGTGRMPEGSTNMDLLARTALVEPFAEGSSTTPIYKDDTLSMVLEFRSDMNGGLKHAVVIQEYGVYASDPDGGEVLLLYGNLGDYNDSFPPYQGGLITTRSYGISVIIRNLPDVKLQFSASAFLTSQDAADLVEAALRRAVDMKAMPLCIPAKAWTDTGSGRFPFVADIADERVKDIHYPDVTLASDSIEVAAHCGLSPVVTALNGSLQFYAQKKPTDDILADCQLFKEGKNDAILLFDLPVATTETIGAIKASDNVIVSEDGQTRVELTEDNFVSDEEWDAALNSIFSPE